MDKYVEDGIKSFWDSDDPKMFEDHSLFARKMRQKNKHKEQLFDLIVSNLKKENITKFKINRKITFFARTYDIRTYGVSPTNDSLTERHQDMWALYEREEVSKILENSLSLYNPLQVDLFPKNGFPCMTSNKEKLFEINNIAAFDVQIDMAMTATFELKRYLSTIPEGNTRPSRHDVEEEISKRTNDIWEFTKKGITLQTEIILVDRDTVFTPKFAWDLNRILKGNILSSMCTIDAKKGLINNFDESLFIAEKIAELTAYILKSSLNEQEKMRQIRESARLIRKEFINTHAYRGVIEEKYGELEPFIERQKAEVDAYAKGATLSKKGKERAKTYPMDNNFANALIRDYETRTLKKVDENNIPETVAKYVLDNIPADAISLYNGLVGIGFRDKDKNLKEIISSDNMPKLQIKGGLEDFCREVGLPCSNRLQKNRAKKEFKRRVSDLIKAVEIQAEKKWLAFSLLDNAVYDEKKDTFTATLNYVPVGGYTPDTFLSIPDQPRLHIEQMKGLNEAKRRLLLDIINQALPHLEAANYALKQWDIPINCDTWHKKNHDDDFNFKKYEEKSQRESLQKLINGALSLVDAEAIKIVYTNKKDDHKLIITIRNNKRQPDLFKD